MRYSIGAVIGAVMVGRHHVELRDDSAYVGRIDQSGVVTHADTSGLTVDSPQTGRTPMLWDEPFSIRINGGAWMPVVTT